MALVTRSSDDISKKVIASTVGGVSATAVGGAAITLTEYFTAVDFPPVVEYAMLTVFVSVVTFIAGYWKRDSVPDAIAISKTPAQAEAEYIAAGTAVNTGTIPVVPTTEEN